MDQVLATIKEIQEGGKFLANWYLDYGYILLDIQTSTRGEQFPTRNAGGEQYYVRRNPIYVLGRPDGVAQAPYPPLRPAVKPPDSPEKPPEESKQKESQQ